MDYQRMGIDGEFAENFEYSGGNLEYWGSCKPDIANPANAVWRIVKFTYDGGGNVLTKRFPNGDNGFLFAWDNRAALNYS